MILQYALKKYLSISRFSKKLSLNTIDLQTRILTKFIAFLPAKTLKDISPQMIQQYFDERKKLKQSPATLRGHYCIVMAFLNHYYKRGLLGFNPFYCIRKVKKHRVHRVPVSLRQLKQLLKAKGKYK